MSITDTNSSKSSVTIFHEQGAPILSCVAAIVFVDCVRPRSCIDVEFHQICCLITIIDHRTPTNGRLDERDA